MSLEYDSMIQKLEQDEKKVVYTFDRRDGSIATITCRTKDHLGALVYHRLLREVELSSV